jgi:hypothetical protein
MKEKGVDLEAILPGLTDSLNETQTGCVLNESKDIIVHYPLAIEEGKENELLPWESKTLPLTLMKAGFDVWIEGNRGSLY